MSKTDQSGVRVRCPHCHERMDIHSEATLQDVTCSSCGSQFNLLADTETITQRPGAARVLGQFELQTPLGTGAFGTVWKARDTTLDRLVACKIPRNHELSSDEREKFFREARAAAQLRHESIVSVHEVGRDGDTIYIISDYVDGLTLADWLTGQQPSIQEAVEIVRQVALALDHAHQHGVIHRDVKPSNIMLDENLKPHVMDFGLAKREAGEVTMTVSGAILGTPAYMSPEQAKGDGHNVDARSDVYALGVVLYELLTGERPFRGNVRMLIHQLLRDEPAPPRKLNSAIPRDLETICLKAMAKETHRRYASAAELAAELQRFLAGEPILARPLGRVERLWRWGRRNPVVAGLSTTLLLSLLGGLAAATTLWLRAESNWSLANTQRDKAEANWDLAEQRREQSDANLQEADEQRRQAEASFEIALDAVEKMLYRVGATQLEDVPQMEVVRGELLEEAEKFFEKLMQQQSTHPRLRRRAGKAHWALADFCQRAGKPQRAERAYREAIAVFRQLVKDNPHDDEYLDDLSAACSNLSVLYNDRIRDRDKAEPLMREAFALRQRLVNDFPKNVSYQHSLGLSYQIMGNWWRAKKRPQKSEDAYKQAIRIQSTLTGKHPKRKSYRAELARAQHAYAAFLASEKREQEADDAYHKAFEIRQELVKRYSGDRRLRVSFAKSLGSLGSNYRRDKRYEDALRYLQRTDLVWKQLISDFPTWSAHREGAGVTSRSIGETLFAMGRFDEAARKHLDAANTWKSLAAVSPERYEGNVGIDLFYAGQALLAAGRVSEAQTHLRSSLVRLRSAIPRLKRFRAYHMAKYRDASGLLIEALARLKRNEAAIQAAREFALGDTNVSLAERCDAAEAIAKLLNGVKSWTDDAAARKALTDGLYDAVKSGLRNAAASKEAAERSGREKLAKAIRYDVATALANQGFHRQAVETRQSAILIHQQMIREFPSEFDYRRKLAFCHDSNAISQRHMNQVSESEESYRKSIEIIETLLIEYPSKAATFQHDLGYLYTNYSLLLDAFDRNDESEQFAKKAVAVRQGLAERFPEQVKYQDTLADSFTSLAIRLNRQGKSKEAERMYRKAIAIESALVLKDPKKSSYRRDLAFWYFNLGNFLMKAGRHPEAEPFLKRALSLREKLASENPRRLEDLKLVASSRISLGLYAAHRGRMDEAFQLLQTVHAARKRLVANFPEGVGLQRDLAYGMQYLAFWYGRSRKWVKTDEWFEKAQTLFDTLAAKHPETRHFLEDANRNRSLHAWWQATSGRYAEAEKLCQAMLSKHPESRKAIHGYVWLVNLFPQPDPKKRELAVTLSEQELKQAPNDYLAWNNAGLARYRVGRWNDARTAFETSMKWRGADSAFDLFPLAMTLWRLEKKQEANAAFDRAAMSMAVNLPREEALQTLHREAATLLGRAADLPKPVLAKTARPPDLNESTRPTLSEILKSANDLLAEGQKSEARDDDALAETSYHRAVHFLKERLVESPLNLNIRLRYTIALTRLAGIQRKLKRLKESELNYQSSIKLHEQFLTGSRRRPIHLQNLSTLLYFLSSVLSDQGRLREAKTALLRSIELQKEARQSKPDDKKLISNLKRRYPLMADLHLRLGEHVETEKLALAVSRFDPSRAGNYFAAKTMARCLSAAEIDGGLSEEKRRRLVTRYRRQAIDLLGRSIAKGYQDFLTLEVEPVFHTLRADPAFRRLLDGKWPAKSDVLIRGELTERDAFDKNRGNCRCKVHQLKLATAGAYEVELATSAFDPKLDIKTTDGSPIDVKANPRQSEGSRRGVILTLKKAGTYEFAVSTTKPGALGIYVLYLKRQQPK